MLELKSELVILVEEVVDLGEDAAPLLLSLRKNSEHWFQPLPIQLGLVVQVLEHEGQLLTLRHSMHREVKPGPVSVFLIGRAIMRYPQPVFIPLVAPRHLGQVSAAEVTVKSDSVVLVILELLRYPLRVLLSQSHEVAVGYGKVLRVLLDLVDVASFTLAEGEYLLIHR